MSITEVELPRDEVRIKIRYEFSRAEMTVVRLFEDLGLHERAALLLTYLFFNPGWHKPGDIGRLGVIPRVEVYRRIRMLERIGVTEKIALLERRGLHGNFKVIVSDRFQVRATDLFEFERAILKQLKNSYERKKRIHRSIVKKLRRVDSVKVYR